MSDPYATPTADLGHPSASRGVRAQRQRTGRIFGVLNLILGVYLMQALLRVVIPGVEAALRGAFSWDLAIYAGLLVLPALLVFKGSLELVAPGYLLLLWRQRSRKSSPA